MPPEVTVRPPMSAPDQPPAWWANALIRTDRGATIARHPRPEHRDCPDRERGPGGARSCEGLSGMVDAVGASHEVEVGVKGQGGPSPNLPESTVGDMCLAIIGGVKW